ncbi:hypothetical protein J5X98_08175 [Leptothermofonsia sichuanensis E412]|uniref:hypothetical protein n=1 Tax=Leptothermofonsia sichuanensis TaxID=2917832 RepID=UPI001CA723F8|nr:hypothetical protein [Leptothermofonsia sichuanensis]QZZ22342.1 hypothetical protein J5X98_08175 [Leptothermofonsia sichuanensis E412]
MGFAALIHSMEHKYRLFPFKARLSTLSPEPTTGAKLFNQYRRTGLDNQTLTFKHFAILIKAPCFPHSFHTVSTALWNLLHTFSTGFPQFESSFPQGGRNHRTLTPPDDRLNQFKKIIRQNRIL